MTDQTVSILLVEDDANQRLSLRTVLDFEGYSVQEAEAALPALDMIRHTVFDVWIIDYRLPDLTGLELIKQGLVISPRSVPIVVTGLNAMDIAIEGMKVGAREYLVKPVNMAELKKIISSIMGERSDFERGKLRVGSVVENIGETDLSEPVIIIESPTEFMAAAGLRQAGFAGLGQRCIRALREYFWDIR